MRQRSALLIPPVKSLLFAAYQTACQYVKVTTTALSFLRRSLPSYGPRVFGSSVAVAAVVVGGFGAFIAYQQFSRSSPNVFACLESLALHDKGERSALQAMSTHLDLINTGQSQVQVAGIDILFSPSDLEGPDMRARGHQKLTLDHISIENSLGRPAYLPENVIQHLDVFLDEHEMMRRNIDYYYFDTDVLSQEQNSRLFAWTQVSWPSSGGVAFGEVLECVSHHGAFGPFICDENLNDEIKEGTWIGPSYTTEYDSGSVCGVRRVLPRPTPT